MKLHKLLALSTLAAALAGCGTLAPNYERPGAPVPNTWPTALQTSGGEQASVSKVNQLHWKDFITDHNLQEIVSLALENNRDLRVAALNLERAQAMYQIQSSASLPGINAGASATHQDGVNGTTHQYSANLGMTGYELDFFGRIQSLNDKAQQEYLASTYALKTVQASLIAQVANGYLAISTEQARLALAKRTLATHQATYELTKKSYELGASTLLAVAQNQTLVEAARADVARYTQQVALAKNALNLLVGATVPEDKLPGKGEFKAVSLSKLNAGVSSEVLLERPDVLAAESKLQAANANIGAARAALYPRITIGASLGSNSAELSTLFDAGTGVWSFMPQVSLPIFDNGKRKADVKVAQVDEQIALAQYEKAIQTAFREVVDTLAEKQNLETQVKAQAALISAAQKTHQLAKARFDQGLDSNLTVLDAQRSLYAAQQGLLSLRQNLYRNHIMLYKALGAGTQA